MLSYAITLCNELKEFDRLVKLLLEHKREEDEIVVLLDKPKASKELEILVENYAHNEDIFLSINYFEGHFADWKNELTYLCKGDYIFQIDADEYPNPDLIKALPQILEANPNVDVYLVPRVNTVEGLTQAHIEKWGWHVNDRGWVNFPDFQWRIYKNDSSIKWINKVHEKLAGYKEFAYLPQTEDYSLFHPKDIERQERQNNFYSTI